MYIRGFTKFEITVACGLKFHLYLSLKFQKARTKIEVFLLAVSAKLRQPTGQRQENFNFGPSLLKFKVLKYQWNFRPHGTVITKFVETPIVHTIGWTNFWRFYDTYCHRINNLYIIHINLFALKKICSSGTISTFCGVHKLLPPK